MQHNTYLNFLLPFLFLWNCQCAFVWDFFPASGVPSPVINRHLCLSTSQIFLINHTCLLHCRNFANLLLKYWRWLGNLSYAIRKVIKSHFERICVEVKSQFSQWKQKFKKEIKSENFLSLVNTFSKKLNFWTKCLLNKSTKLF